MSSDKPGSGRGPRATLRVWPAPDRGAGGAEGPATLADEPAAQGSPDAVAGTAQEAEPLGLAATQVPDSYGPNPAALGSSGPGEVVVAAGSLLTRVTPECPERYALGEERGRGGQARVLLAEDRHVGRAVAWKELLLPVGRPSLRGVSSSESLDPGVARFLREARVTGQLEHPGIVPIYEVGQRADGRYYYTMRLVRGRTLAAVLAGCGGLADRLSLLGHFVDVCHAIAYAHSRGVLHRDLKPANVMVGPFGETVLLDWGLAKVRGQSEQGTPDEAAGAPPDSGPGDLDPLLRYTDADATVDGVTLGTPAYMSPEQALGKLDQIDERSDVWSLGAMLYEFLTGSPPFTGGNAYAIATKVCMEDAPPVLARCPDAPPELAAVAHKALSRDPRQRYESARALAADVSAYMTGGRVTAYGYSRRALLGRFARRHKAALLAATLTLMAILSALVVTSLAYRDELSARQREAVARDREHDARLWAHGHLSQALTRRAELLVADRLPLSSRVYAAAALVHNPTHPHSPHHDAAFARAATQLHPWRVRAQSILWQTDHRVVAGLRREWRHASVPYRANFTPDGAHFAVVDYEGWVTVRDATTGETTGRALAHAGAVRDLTYTRDGRALATAGRDGTIRLRDADTLEPLIVITASQGPLGVVALSPSGTLVAAAGDEDPEIGVWDTATGARRHTLARHGGKIEGLVFSPDGRLLASSSWDREIWLHDVETGARLRTLTGHTEAVYRVVFTADGRHLLSAGYDHRVLLWDVATGAQVRVFAGHRHAVNSVAISPDGRLVASGAFDGEVRLWRFDTGRPVLALSAHADTVESVEFSPDGRWLVTASIDQTVRQWALNPDDGLRRFTHDEWVFKVALSADGKRAATGGWDQTARIYDARTGERLQTFQAPGEVTPVALSPDGARLVTPEQGHRLAVWDTATGERVLRLPGHRATIGMIDFRPDGKQIASAARDGTVWLWSLEEGVPHRALPEHPDRLLGLTYRPDGGAIATACNDHVVRVFDSASGETLHTLRGHRDWVSGVAFSPDGRTLATSGKDRTVLLWDLTTGQLAHRLTGHAQWVNRVTFSPDGRLLASAGDDRLAILWDLATRTEIRRFAGENGFTDVTFTPDGQHIALADADAATLYPLTVEPATPANDLLVNAQRQAGVRLAAFDLVPTAPEQIPSAPTPPRENARAE